MDQPSEGPTEKPEERAVIELTGAEAALLNALAKLSGQTAQEYALDRISRGLPVLNTTAIGDDSRVAFGLVDGPTDLSTSCHGFGE
ncbi:hypothetical protein LKL35_36030 [Streptomyces sp. ET3-23]|uniref:hypothetical protein n=1 Tax=Streptomyces sp. ET3-23 TaxID=2885643 RepID=UPI001D12E9F4|nr:hypothetical protein [Streptomyces sp. ET3-23]MCC2280747.1 hypothetical protein [Streptomyces sp. ET3-23]